MQFFSGSHSRGKRIAMAYAIAQRLLWHEEVAVVTEDRDFMEAAIDDALEELGVLKDREVLMCGVEFFRPGEPNHMEDLKPLPAGTRRPELLCGRCDKRINPREKIALDLESRCSECGGQRRRWWRRRVNLWEKFSAWLAQRAWKKRRK